MEKNTEYASCSQEGQSARRFCAHACGRETELWDKDTQQFNIMDYKDLFFFCGGWILSFSAMAFSILHS